MERTRLLEILTELEASGEPLPRALCRACARVIHVTGAGLTLLIAGGSGPLCASDATSARIEDLQFTLGEGPSPDSHVLGKPVTGSDLGGADRTRWPSFSAGALAAGAAAVFSFPLRVGAVRIGALTLYQAAPGSLSDEQHADALAMAGLAVHEILVLQAGAPPGGLATALAELGSYRAEVHQASGMVAVMLGLSVPDGLVRLRAHAFSEGRPLAQVAGDVVGRRLRLEP